MIYANVFGGNIRKYQNLFSSYIRLYLFSPLLTKKSSAHVVISNESIAKTMVMLSVSLSPFYAPFRKYAFCECKVYGLGIVNHILTRCKQHTYSLRIVDDEIAAPDITDRNLAAVDERLDETTHIIGSGEVEGLTQFFASKAALGRAR